MTNLKLFNLAMTKWNSRAVIILLQWSVSW